MLLDAHKTGFGLGRPAAPEKEEASPLFIGISTLLLIAVNIRTLGTLWIVFIVLLCVVILSKSFSSIFSLMFRQPILILLPVFYVLSCLWSDEFTISLSLGMQTLLATLTAVTIAQRTTNRQFLLIIFLAISFTCIGCILDGEVGPSAEGMVLIGYLGSKDAMGLMAYSGVMTSLAMMLDRERSFMMRGFAILMALVELRIATSVHAATAIVCLGLGVSIFLLTYFVLARFTVARWISYFFISLMAMAFLVFASEFVQLFLEMSSSHLGKDASLTGRTVLWEKGLALLGESPLIGHGYRAFWAGSSFDARHMLASMNIADGRGFHFHEQYLEVLVDTGILGFLVFLSTFVIFTKKILKSAIVQPSCYTAYAFAIVVVDLIRWVFETAFLPFSFDMMIFYGLAAAAMRPPKKIMKKAPLLSPLDANKPTATA